MKMLTACSIYVILNCLTINASNQTAAPDVLENANPYELDRDFLEPCDLLDFSGGYDEHAVYYI